MFGNSRTNRRPSKLDLEIDRILEAMGKEPVTSKDYYEMAARLDDLTKVKNYDKQVNELTKVVVSSVIYGGFSILSIGMILKFEKFETVLSKAVQFIPKWRV